MYSVCFSTAIMYSVCFSTAIMFVLALLSCNYILPPFYPIQFSYLAGNKKKTWKNLKQIMTAEKGLGLGPNDPTCKLIT